jgi:putative ABC transport system substrate-binding protein
MRRREFITLLGGAAAWPLAARAQQSAMAIPVIGFLASSSADAPSGPVAAIHLALKQAGYEVGQTVRMEYRYANNRLERLPALADELVKIPAAVIITSGGPGPTLAAKAATTTIPIVFAPVPDPVRSGLVASFNRPGGNITGVAALTIELDPKRLELLHELAPSSGLFAVLLNPSRPDTQIQLENIKTAARSVGRELVLAYANTVRQIDGAFATFAERSVAGLLVAADPLFTSQRTQARNPPWLARDISMARIRRCRWPGKLRTQPFRFLPASWSVRRPHSQGRKARRPAGAATHDSSS